MLRCHGNSWREAEAANEGGARGRREDEGRKGNRNSELFLVPTGAWLRKGKRNEARGSKRREEGGVVSGGRRGVKGRVGLAGGLDSVSVLSVIPPPASPRPKASFTQT